MRIKKWSLIISLLSALASSCKKETNISTITYHVGQLASSIQTDLKKDSINKEKLRELARLIKNINFANDQRHRTGKNKIIELPTPFNSWDEHNKFDAGIISLSNFYLEWDNFEALARKNYSRLEDYIEIVTRIFDSLGFAERFFNFVLEDERIYTLKALYQVKNDPRKII